MKKAVIVSLCALVLVSAGGCGRQNDRRPDAPAVTSSPAQLSRRIASVEIYNRTGRIQREDFYDYSGGTGKVAYSVEYSYNDYGSPTSVKKVAGGLGNDRFLESYLYSGQNCTQHIVYDNNGSTKEVHYWTYDKKGRLTQSRTVTMLPADNGYGYSGKAEEISEYNTDGTVKIYKCSKDGDWSRDEYEYDDSAKLIKDSYYHSSDGKTYRLFEERFYTYNEDGNITEIRSINGLGQVSRLEVNEYDESGRLIRESVYPNEEKKEGTEYSQHYYEYNDSGRLVYESDFEGKDSSQISYEYDGNGNPVRETETRYVSGQLKETLQTVREYDRNNSLVKEYLKRPDGVDRLETQCEYEYYSGGYVKTKTNYELY